jgi:hypothetical protein
MARLFLVCFICILLAQHTLAESEKPQLVVLNKNTNKHGGSEETFVHDVRFSASSITILVSQGSRAQIWTLGAETDLESLGASYFGIQSGKLIGDKRTAILSAPLQLSIVNTRTGRRDQIETKTIEGWFLAALTNGICALSERDANQSRIEIRKLLTPSAGKRSIKLDSDESVLDIDFSPDATRLAVAVNRSKIHLYSLTERMAKESLAMTHSQAAPTPLLNTMKQLNQLRPRFLIEQLGMANVIKFSPDGKKLAAANETAIHVWDLTNLTTPSLLGGYKGRISAMMFDVNGRLFAGGEDKIVRMWEPGKQEGIEIAYLPEIPAGIYVRKDGEIFAACFKSGEMQLWNSDEQRLMAKFHFFPSEQGFVVVTPDGLFDSSEGAWRNMGWKLTHGETLPLERFFRDFFEPGLVSELLSMQHPTAGTRLEDLDRSLPNVTLKLISSEPAKAELFPGGIRQAPERSHFRVECRPGTPGGGVCDLQVTHNEQTIRKWKGKVPLHTGTFAQEFDVELFPWENKIAASAYNLSGLRSEEAVWSRPMQGYGYSVPRQTLYVISVGISSNLNSQLTLQFAENDAKDFARAFSFPNVQLQTMGKRVAEWNNRKSMRLLEAFKWETMPTAIEVTNCVNEHATRTGILNLLKQIVQRAKPTDSFIFYFSGHGISDEENYYLIPFDAKLPEGMVRGDDGPPNFKMENANLISDTDLEEILWSLDVSHAAIILDACQSGKALKGFKQRGLFNPQGLGRLAYEKGINFLAASESDRSAFEPKKLGHSVLNHALVQEGLFQGRADFDPYDGRIDLREWLSYAANRSAELTSVSPKGINYDDSAKVAQRAILAPRIIPEREILVLKAAEKEP